MDDQEGIRIGELSRRSGVSAGLLRMWERRYGILDPSRTPGGQRRYSAADERRVAEMRRHIASGLSASAAARRLASGPADAGDPDDAFAGLRARLEAALDRFDEPAANAALDTALSRFSIPAALAGVVMPYLQSLGARWEAGRVSIAQEHFATMILRGRLLGLARNWGSGPGPGVLLAAPPHEHHDLGLICLGLGLREWGWRVTLLGPNTPGDTLVGAAAELDPDLVVVASMQEDLLGAVAEQLAAIAADRPVMLAGPGASAALAERTGAGLLAGAPIDAARALVDDPPPRPARAPAGV
jgi:DNA-binding transcriptional MerR regulator